MLNNFIPHGPQSLEGLHKSCCAHGTWTEPGESHYLRSLTNKVKFQYIINFVFFLEERDVERFDLLLQNTALQWSEDPSTVEFYKYFTANYSQRFKQWAMCYRKRACINTNMFVEAFHRVLKYVYLKGTVNKRIDACISMLLRFARDKLFDRLQKKLEKGENTSRLQLIANRHRPTWLA